MNDSPQNPSYIDRWELIHTPRSFFRTTGDVYPAQRFFVSAVFWVFLLLVILSSGIAVINLLSLNPSRPGAPLVVAVVMSAAVVAAVWFVLSRLRIYFGTPRRLVALSLWWGASAGTVLPVLTSQDFGGQLAMKLGWVHLVESFNAAWAEEVAKALGVWMILWIGRSWWNRPWHGLLAGAFVGLGFDVYENSLYAVRLSVMDPTSDGAGAFDIYLARVAFGLGLHMLCSGIVGYGIGRALLAGPKRSVIWRLGQVFGWGFVGFGVHFLWNVEWPPTYAIVIMVLVWSVGLTVFAVLVAWHHQALKAEVESGNAPAVTVFRRL